MPDNISMNNDARIIIIISSNSSTSTSSSSNSSSNIVVDDVAFPQQQWYTKAHLCYVIHTVHCLLVLLRTVTIVFRFKVRSVRLISLDELKPYLRELILQFFFFLR
jgi:uncharacterized UPF0146 family protein